MIKIPRCMSTQHPDNVATPFFAGEGVLAGEDEIKEAYYVFSALGCEEQMWDCEGKEVDAFVVKKLLTKYEAYFREHVLGEDVFVTLRVPNPEVEKAEAKILLETLESIPRSYDAARLFYERDVCPIFEVILPMTSSHKALNRVYLFYKNFVAGKQYERIYPGDVTIAEWIGEFRPEEINIIPLLEDEKSILGAAEIISNYLRDKSIDCQRIFLARSDPALNYGMVSAVLLNKVALQRLGRVQEELGVELYPIIGVGSAPFRGNFSPPRVEGCLEGYPSVQTFTLQSAFKYDYPQNEVLSAVNKIKRAKRGRALPIEEDRALGIAERFSSEYSRDVALLAPLVDRLSRHIPRRRARKLHIGLFGYPRSHRGIKLPRAITFCAALYSVGLPPELLGVAALREKDLDYLSEVYRGFELDMRDAVRYFSVDGLRLVPERLADKLREAAKRFGDGRDEAHAEAVKEVINALGGGDVPGLEEKILHAAWLRRFLG
jgi:phosphoenolpyruvate carboxylase